VPNCNASQRRNRLDTELDDCRGVALQVSIPSSLNEEAFTKVTNFSDQRIFSYKSGIVCMYSTQNVSFFVLTVLGFITDPREKGDYVGDGSQKGRCMDKLECFDEGEE
jgi:hypothetical protein